MERLLILFPSAGALGYRRSSLLGRKMRNEHETDPRCRAARPRGRLRDALPRFPVFRDKNTASLFLSLFTSPISHSHIMSTFQPSRSSSAVLRRSRRTFPRRFSSQNLLLVFGLTLPYRQLWMCQKQPCTKMILLCLRRTKSGVPGNFRLCNP